ncbi:MAG: hypothetical protein ACK55E_09425 [Cyanobacteriota bacterium]|jgi:uncharacterized membrane protein
MGALRVGQAMREGWMAFRQAPVPFVAFSLLVALLQLPINVLQDSVTVARSQGAAPSALLLSLLLSLLATLVNLWGIAGLVRGSWIALEGGRPRLGTLLHWDGAALWRLLLATLLLALLLALLLLPFGPVLQPIATALEEAAATGLPATLPVTPLGAAALVLGLGIGLYLAVNQSFLGQIALLEGPGPWRTLLRGRDVVDPQWLQVLLLHLLQALLILIGVLACLVGVFVALPVVTCISTAAWRQLAGSGDRLGFARQPG